MSRLFSANMMRLQKSKIFLIGEIFMVGYALFVYESAASTIASKGSIDNWNTYFFNVLLAIGIVMAMFVSFFLGTEYGDGTIRNKLMVGHKRRDIYLVNFLSCLLAGLVMCATYYLFSLIFGCLFIGKEILQIQNIGRGLLCSMLILTVYTAIFVSVEMLDHNKARSMAVNSLGALFILMIGIVSYGQLVSHPDTAGFMWHIIEMLLPSVLVMHTASGTKQIPYITIVLGLSIETACFMGIGIWGFGRKDIK